jgi:hypothetical protein
MTSAKVAEIFDTMDYGPAPESDKTVREWLEQHNESFGHFINNKWVMKGKTFTTENPASGEKLAKIAIAGKAEVDAAVRAARAAQKRRDARRLRTVAGAAAAAARAGSAGREAGSDDRRSLAGDLQFRLLRAFVPRPRNGH